MKKITGLLLGIAFLFGMNTQKSIEGTQTNEISVQMEETAVCVSTENTGLTTQAKAAYLMEYGTKTPIYAFKETERLPIASMCKIMTLLLSFEAVEEGLVSMEEEICVSENAAAMGGSQVFLEANAKYPVRELIKSIVVCSANDSCVAMAEKIAGSESAFVDRMNEKAKELGAENTLFANCTGLPKQPQYSCAKDVAVMLKSLLKYEEYHEFGKVWMDKFAHPKGRYTEITNTNKLVRFYDGCDGGKTGFTNEAGFCLAATAKRENMRIISVVIGEETSANRFEDVRFMFDYAFANYKVSSVAEENVNLTQAASVKGGKVKSVCVYPKRTAYAFMKKGEKDPITTQVHVKALKAPIQQGESVGELIVFKNGFEVDRVELLAASSVRKANLFDYFKDVAENWNVR